MFHDVKQEPGVVAEPVGARQNCLFYGTLQSYFFSTENP